MSATDLSEHQARNDTVLTQQLDIFGGHAGRGGAMTITITQRQLA